MMLLLMLLLLLLLLLICDLEQVERIIRRKMIAPCSATNGDDVSYSSVSHVTHHTFHVTRQHTHT